MKKINNESEDYRLGNNRQENSHGRSQVNQFKLQQDINRNKEDSVKPEMRNKSRENHVQAKSNSKDEGKNQVND